MSHLSVQCTHRSGQFTRNVCLSHQYIYHKIVVSRHNIALGRPTFQSSVHIGLNSSLGVDGTVDPRSALRGCFHTSGTDPNPYWIVSLDGPVYVHSVYVLNRSDWNGK